MLRNLKLLAVCILFVMTSCAEDVIDSRRIRVAGRLIDDMDSPVSNIHITSGSKTTILGASASEITGNFDFVSLESNRGEFQIQINSGTQRDSLFAEVILVNDLSSPNRSRLNYDLGDIIVKPTAFLNLKTQNTSGTSDTLKILLDYTSNYCSLELDNDKELLAKRRCYSTHTSRIILHAQDSNYDTRVTTVKNEIARLYYRFNNGYQQVVEIPLTNTENTYVFEY